MSGRRVGLTKFSFSNAPHIADTARGAAAFLILCMACFSVQSMGGTAWGQPATSPLQFLKEQEQKNKDAHGEVYLGKVMTLTYGAYSVVPGKKYDPFLLELTDVLKTPMRKNYRMVLKGYSDASGSAAQNLSLSRRRAQTLKKILIEKYYMKEKRISTEGHGDKDPVASNETARGRQMNRRVEIHVYGDVSEAVRFMDTGEETK